jgi:beta-lactamase superfamily II metal-dependent hydrolase
MAYEIDFLPVGDPGEDGRCCRSGDAIAIRWGNLSGPRSEQSVIIIDGGFTSSGEALVAHVQKYYRTDVIDFVVSSHPHDDHIIGLFPVLENLRVGTLLMHKPWEHARAVVDLLNDERHTYTGSRKRIRESFRSAVDLHDLAVGRSIRVIEPFAGLTTTDNCVTCLGPTPEFYQQLVAADSSDQDVSDTVKSIGAFEQAMRFLARKMTEAWDSDALAEPSIDAVEPLNHTSTILHFDFGTTQALLTADAGVVALERALAFANERGIDLTRCSRVQVPHHGSKRNVGPEILNRILGPILPAGSGRMKTGMLSAATHGAPKHPSARVTNAFARRGAPVGATQGRAIRWSSPDAPPRPDYSPIEPIPFAEMYDEDE